MEMQQNGDDPRGHAPVTPIQLFAELLDAPHKVAALPAAAVRPVLLQVAGAQERLSTLTVMLSIRLLELGTAADAPPQAPSEAGALTQAEAAAQYRMPLRTIRQLTRAGRIPSYLLGRNRMLRAADMDRYLARCRAQGVKVGKQLDV
jgi:excisionase family DNA binding protein